MPLPKQPKGDPTQRPQPYSPLPTPNGNRSGTGCRGTPQFLTFEARGEEGLSLSKRRLGSALINPLASGRSNLVFGEGNPHARLMFIGEGPGYHEDRRVGPLSGQRDDFG